MTVTLRALRLLWALATLGLAVVLLPWLAQVWVGAAALVLLALLIDAARGLRSSPIAIERELATSLALNVRTQAACTVHNNSDRVRSVHVQDAVPTSFEVEALPRKVSVPAKGHARISYWLRATRRGEFELGEVPYRLLSPWRLWRRRLSAADSAVTLRVFPNFRAVARYALLATDNRQSQLGIKQRQRRGEGLEFHQLREYRAGDTMRQIDWRATSRLNKAISREYRDERDQQIVFLLDCSRRMHGDEDGLSLLDHTLNATLLLAYVALRQGDAVGLAAFGGQERWLAPRKGATHLTSMLNASYDLQTSTVAPDMYVALEQTLARLRRRSLIVVLTNLRDELDPDLDAVLRLSRRRHLVLLTSLREPSLRLATEAEPSNFTNALRLASTLHYLRAREDAHNKLRSAGALYLDVEPAALSVSLVNRYLDIKAAGVL